MPPMTDFLQLSETDYFECKHDFSVPRSSVDVGEYSYISKSRGRCDDKSVRIKKKKGKTHCRLPVLELSPTSY